MIRHTPVVSDDIQVTGVREALRMPSGLVLTMPAHDWLFPLVCVRVDCAAFFGVTLLVTL
jgi:hypothetical protein